MPVCLPLPGTCVETCCVKQQALHEIELVLKQLEMDAAALEPLALVGQPQACLFFRSHPLPFQKCFCHSFYHHAAITTPEHLAAATAVCTASFIASFNSPHPFDAAAPLLSLSQIGAPLLPSPGVSLVLARKVHLHNVLVHACTFTHVPLALTWQQAAWC